MTKVSVVVPTYNRTEKLKRALESVITQNFKDIELIVVDDNPSEVYRQKTKKTVEQVAEKTDFSVERMINDGSQGVSSARNLGVKKASGEYIAFLDDDDEWKQEKITKQLDIIQAGGVNAVYTASEIYDGQINDVIRKTQNLNLNSILERDRIGSPSKVMIEKRCLEKVEGFDEDIPSGEDWDLWIRLINNGCKFGYIDEPLTRYHQANDSKSSQKEIATEGREKITEKHSKLLENAGSKVKARHHLNRAKKQYQLRDDTGTKKHLSKSLKNNKLDLEAYALLLIYIIRRFTGKDIMFIGIKLKSRVRNRVVVFRSK